MSLLDWYRRMTGSLKTQEAELTKQNTDLKAQNAALTQQVSDLKAQVIILMSRLARVGSTASAPVAPTISLGTATSTTQPVTISAQGSGASSWQMQYALASSGSWSNFGSLSVGDASITVTGLSASTSYDYRIVATNAVGSTNSNTATGSTASGSYLPSLILWSDITYLPTNGGSTDRVIQLWMINPPASPVVRINNKMQTVLSVIDESGIGGSSQGLPIHPGLKKAGLVSAVSGYIKRVVVHVDNVVSGDTQITVDGATLTDGVSTQLDFTVGSTGRLLFVDAATGNDSNDGLTTATAWATFAPFIGTTTGKRAIRGDVLYVRSGTYSDTANAGYSPSQPTVIECGNMPSSGLTISIVNYRGERPRIYNKLKWVGAASGGGQSGFNICGFEVDTCGSTSDRDPTGIDGANDWRFVGNIFHNCTCPYHILGADYSTRIQELGNEIYSCNIGSTSNQNHPIYHGGYATQDKLWIMFNHIHDNGGGRGIQLFGHGSSDLITNALINYNNVHGMRCDGIRVGGTDYAANPDWIASLDVIGNTCHDNNSVGDADFSDIRIGALTDSAGHGPTMSLRKNVCYNTTRAINIENAKQCNYSDNCYEGSFVVQTGNATNDGGNSGSYPACY